ncbi:MAG TPA: gamma-glutamyltransferase, partial [Dongiaceae bacterium]|nr:gamma-glutamyltransferase [Dongiaceae bacterium]
PYSAGIGGGGFWLLHQAKDGKTLMLDAREKAPSAATATMFLDGKGGVDRDKATNSPLSAGIPGQAAALDHLARHYGKLPLKATLAPAITFAENGFPSNPVYTTLATFRAPVLMKNPDSARIFLADGQPLANATLRQPELAATLKALADKGSDGFYKGEVAQKLVDGVKAGGGIWSLEDLAAYRLVEREPVHFRYRDAEIWSAPPPSSGGIALGEMFGMLQQFDYAGKNSLDRTHLLIEVMRRAYRDRAEYLGDPDFVDVPVKKLLDPIYLEEIAANISGSHATPSKDLPPVAPPPSGPHTTHFSIIDKDGNRVAATLSINLPFGCGYTVAGTGVLLNNEMDDFSAQPGTPNAYGLVGTTANAIAPGKRPLSSMTPTFMEYGPADHRQLAIIGTPGGSRIISMVFLGLLEALDGKNSQAWVDRPRFHHQYLPDVVEYEPGALPPALTSELDKRGHKLLETERPYGDMHAIRWDLLRGTVEAASDKRRLGSAQVGALPK